MPVPAPPPGGSTDADLGGVEVTPEEMSAEELALTDTILAAVGLPTWSQVGNKAHSYLGTYPPGRLRENVNRFTIAFYGTASIAAAWCFIFIWYVLRSLGADGLIGGKQAYVPWIVRLKGCKIGSSGAVPGAICAISKFSHIGWMVADRGSDFLLLSGNSTSGGSSDAITVKRYPKTVISAHVNLAYAKTPPKPTPPPPAPAPAGDFEELHEFFA